jgi:D-alanine--poly(phosphoribitol) ligase subunit 2
MDSLTQTILAWLKKAGAKFGNVEIAPDTELIEQGVLDSLEVLRLVSFLEERFGIVVPVEEFVPENFRTPAMVAAMMTRLRSAAGSVAPGP